jgi:hypothetical protein
MGRQSRQARRAQQRRQATQSTRHPNRWNLNWSIVGPAAAAVVALAVFAIVLIPKLTSTSSASSNNQANGGGPRVANVRCGSLTMGTPGYHVHAHLAVYNKGKPVTTTTSDTGHYINGDCLYWLHAHDTSGIIHIEAPQGIVPTLGTWLGVEKITMPPLGESYPALAPKPGLERRVWLNGKRYNGDPLKIALKSHEQIVVEFGPPWVKPPKFTFPSGY